MKYLPITALVVVQTGATIFIMECVRRDLFFAAGVSCGFALAVAFLVRWLQLRIASIASGKTEP